MDTIKGSEGTGKKGSGFHEKLTTSQPKVAIKGKLHVHSLMTQSHIIFPWEGYSRIGTYKGGDEKKVYG